MLDTLIIIVFQNFLFSTKTKNAGKKINHKLNTTRIKQTKLFYFFYDKIIAFNNMFCVLCKERTKSLKIPFRMKIPLKNASQKPLETAITKGQKTNLKKT
ncbi:MULTISPECIES: hypothetical protein [unclassified Bartonella]|uniref:hypothetical protein n=1 Tax=unclassified Bartonella TaxID=2645622 RepID=UPI0035D0CB9C